MVAQKTTMAPELVEALLVVHLQDVEVKTPIDAIEELATFIGDAAGLVENALASPTFDDVAASNMLTRVERAANEITRLVAAIRKGDTRSRS